MDTLSSVLEQLSSLTAPSVVALQALVGAPFEGIECGGGWKCHAAYPRQGMVDSVEYRERADTGNALVILTFRRHEDMQQLLDRYGKSMELLMTPHASSISYKLCLDGRLFGIRARGDGVIQEVSISYDARSASLPTTSGERTCD
jgi:hypothetical protein